MQTKTLSAVDSHNAVRSIEPIVTGILGWLVDVAARSVATAATHHSHLESVRSSVTDWGNALDRGSVVDRRVYEECGETPMKTPALLEAKIVHTLKTVM